MKKLIDKQVKQRLRKGIDFDGWMVKWSGDGQWHTHVWSAKKPEKTPDWEIHRVRIIDLGVVK